MAKARAKAKQRAARETPGTALPSVAWLGLLYGLAGFAALVHEVAWTRTARSLLGGDARAVAVTLVAILGGMGLGGLLAPAVARRFGPLGGFARLEAAAALYAGSLPFLAGAADGLVGIAFRSMGPGAAFTATSATIATLLFTPPALAMGAGLPLLAEARAPAGRTPRDAGAFYAVHALGGAAGGLAAAFVLTPDLGVPLSVALATVLQLGVAGSAEAIARRSGAATTAAAEDTGAETAASPGTRFVLVAVAIAGVATAALQTLWTRIASLALGPSVQGFGAIAALYVLALAVGAGATAPLAKRTARPAAAYAALLLAAGAAVLLGMPAIGAWPDRAAEAYASMQPGSVPPWLALIAPMALPVAVPVALSAAAFPFAVAAIGPKGRRAPAREVGWLVAAGALGNVVGVLLATFSWVPALGHARALAAAALMLCAAGYVAVWSSLRGQPGRPALRKRHATIMLALTAVVIAAIAVAPRQFDPDALLRGPFLYAGANAPELGEIVFVHHGVEASVAVREVGAERILQIDGKVDGSGIGDGPTQTLVGLVPALLAKRPERSLVIGLGTGMTADALRASPRMERVEVAELVDGVRFATPSLAQFNGNVLEDERVHLAMVDGSLLLRHGEEHWDVVVSQPSNPWVAGMGDLFSEETFHAARERLTDGGVFATWLHVYSTDLEIVRSVVATFSAVFEDATLWELARGEDYLLIGSAARGPAAIDLDALAARANDREIRARLARAHIASAEGLLARLVATGEGLRIIADGAPTLSARHGGLEARAARSLYADASRDALELFATRPARAADFETTAHGPEGLALEAALDSALEAGALGREVVLRALDGDEDRAIAKGERAVGLLPDDPSLRDALATLYLARGKTHALVREDEDAREVLGIAIDLEPEPRILADALTTLGDVELRAGTPALALGRYRAARRLAPTVPLLAERIAECLDALGASEDAARERAEAERLRQL